MIALLGSTGYVGSAFARELEHRQLDYRPISRQHLDYTRFDSLLAWLREQRPCFVINAAGFTGRPNVDACESDRAGTLAGNTLLPATMAHACSAAGIPWGHVSSGCIYSGAKILSATHLRIERDLTRSEVRALVLEKSPSLHGFTEDDLPNFSFRQPPCSFYSGTKALAEEALAGGGPGYVWRLRIPFDRFDGSRNYLSKLQRYPRVYENTNSLSHRGDFVRACLDLWERRAPYGVNNVTNPGYVTSHQVVELISRILRPSRAFTFWDDDAKFYREAAKTPRSNCILDVSKLIGAGVSMRPVLEAIEDSLSQWVPESN